MRYPTSEERSERRAVVEMGHPAVSSDIAETNTVRVFRICSEWSSKLSDPCTHFPALYHLYTVYSFELLLYRR